MAKPNYNFEKKLREQAKKKKKEEKRLKKLEANATEEPTDTGPEHTDRTNNDTES
ncbi:MAG: hypothetical protein ACI90U_001609 [Pseudomonadales bacterium]|jgi:hypothetical protein